MSDHSVIDALSLDSAPLLGRYSQLDPLLKIQSMNCLTASANTGLPSDDFQKETAKCTATIDKEIEEWKKAHQKK